MQAQLGSIIFEGLKGFESFASTKEANYAEHALIEGKPKLQRVGDNLENLQVSVLFDVAFCSPQSEIDALEAARSAGEILPLIMGDGRFAGTFIIKSAAVTHQKQSNVGSILQAEVSLTLLEFATGDPASVVANTAIREAFANPINKMPLLTPSFPPSTEAAIASVGVIDVNADLKQGSFIMGIIDTFPAAYKANIERILRRMINSNQTAARILAIIDSEPQSKLFEITRDLSQKCQEVEVMTNNTIALCQQLLDEIEAGNASNITLAVDQIKELSIFVTELSDDLMASASKLTAYLISL
jgi:phage protein U